MDGQDRPRGPDGKRDGAHVDRGSWLSVDLGPAASGLDDVDPGLATDDGRPPHFLLVRSRDVLLKALMALRGHNEALTIVGAQAVYEHTKRFTDVPFTMTNDGDISVDPSMIMSEPRIAELFLEIGFRQSPDRPGIWLVDTDEHSPPGVDLLVPEAIAGPGRRGVRIDGQGRSAVGRAAGLEMALLDRERKLLQPIGSGTGGAVSVYVAGPSALLCAKSYKLAERIHDAELGKRSRVRAKDAGDVWRLMAVAHPREVRATFRLHEKSKALGPAITRGRIYMCELFGHRGRAVDLAVEDLGGDIGEARVRAAISEWMVGFDE